MADISYFDIQMGKPNGLSARHMIAELSTDLRSVLQKQDILLQLPFL